MRQKAAAREVNMAALGKRTLDMRKPYEFISQMRNIAKMMMMMMMVVTLTMASNR